MEAILTWGEFVCSIDLALRDKLKDEEISSLELDSIEMKRVPLTQLLWKELPEIDVTVNSGKLAIKIVVGGE